MATSNIYIHKFVCFFNFKILIYLLVIFLKLDSF